MLHVICVLLVTVCFSSSAICTIASTGRGYSVAMEETENTTNTRKSLLVDDEMIATDAVIVPRIDASSQQADKVVKSPSYKSTTKQPKLCTTHFGKKECNFKSHNSPKTHDSRTSQEDGKMFHMFNLSAAVCSAVVLPTFYILFVSIRR